MSGRSFGYARVSTDDQNLALQLEALTNHEIPAFYKSVEVDLSAEDRSLILNYCYQFPRIEKTVRAMNSPALLA